MLSGDYWYSTSTIPGDSETDSGTDQFPRHHIQYAWFGSSCLLHHNMGYAGGSVETETLYERLGSTLKVAVCSCTVASIG